MPSYGDYWQYFGGQTFGPTHLPDNVDLTGKTIVLTGGNSGLGLDASKHLARMKPSLLILGCRDLKKGEAAKADILSTTNCEETTTIEVWEVDLDHYSSVVDFTQRIQSQLERLDGFISNAGVEPTTFGIAEGLEETLTVNVISTFLMALGVLPKLSETSTKFGVQTNLTMVNSMAHLVAQDHRLDIPEDRDIFDALSEPDKAGMYITQYQLSKLIAVLILREMAQRWESTRKDQVVINEVNPGWCDTGLHRYKNDGLVTRIFFALIARTSEKGSRMLVHGVCAGPETHGCYLSESVVKPVSSFARSERGQELGKRLWYEMSRRIETACPGVTSCIR